MRSSILVVYAGFAACGAALKLPNPYSAYSHDLHREGLEVDLGYARYEGQTNGNISTWFGVRFGAPTGGASRFQAPKTPSRHSNESDVIQASSFASACSQILFGGIIGSEDCLFLNVYAPENAKDLPVFIFIHGGAYQGGQAGGSDPTDLIINNNNRFIAVMIQYRLGVFGFLGTEETKQHGQLNAGLLDMELSLQWVQNYIHLFGGDPGRVTISGESAGAGAVMLMSILRGGKLGDSLFDQIIGASPYLPKQFDYDGSAPQILYNNVSSVLGCDGSHNSFKCLVKADVDNLTTAGFNIDNDPRYSRTIWGFVPVTDGVILQDLPSQQLERKEVNGNRILIGYNSNEGSLFTPTGINTEQDFDNYLNSYLPSVSHWNKQLLKTFYPSTHDTNSSLLDYDTSGYREHPNVNSMSDWANGQQQRAFNMLAETLFICPTYWLSKAFPEAWKYEFAVSPAYHSYDTQAYFFSNQDHPAFTDDFVYAFQNMWGNFVVNRDPQISHSLACGSMCNSGTPANTDITHWPLYSEYNPTQLIVNTTSPNAGICSLFIYALRCAVGPGLENNFTLVDAQKWQGGRGERCDIWQQIGPSVPE